MSLHLVNVLPLRETLGKLRAFQQVSLPKICAAFWLAGKGFESILNDNVKRWFCEYNINFIMGKKIKIVSSDPILSNNFKYEKRSKARLL
jgi:hypothetical protein